MNKPICIIGGGIIGTAIAREIRERDIGEVVLFEKETELAQHASGRNSGVIHSGFNQTHGTLKARLCVSGSRMLREYCTERKVPFSQCGTYVVARNEREREILNRLFLTGWVNGVPNLKMISGEELREREPSIKAQEALYSPTGAIVHSRKLVETIAKDAQDKGAHFELGTRVLKITPDRLITTKGDFAYGHVINCAGLHADKYAHQMGVGLEYVVIPFRGDYHEVRVPVNSMVYQAPNLKYPFLGVHFTLTTEEKVLAGPTASLAFGREAYGKEFSLEDTLEMVATPNFARMLMSREFLALAYHNAEMSLFPQAFLDEINGLLVEPIKLEDLKPAKSGIRAQTVNRRGQMVNDIVIERTSKSTHVLNAVSPGMTCSLAFAKYVVGQLTKVSHKSFAYVCNLTS